MSNALTKRLLKLVQSDFEYKEEDAAINNTNNKETIGPLVAKSNNNNNKKRLSSNEYTSSSTKNNNTNKRQRRTNNKNNDNNIDEIATQDDIINWQIRLIKHGDNQITKNSDNKKKMKKNSSNVFSRHTNNNIQWSTEILQQIEKDENKKVKAKTQYKQNNITNAGACRTTTNIIQTIQQQNPQPTFNKILYKKQQKQLETIKLAKKFMLLDKKIKRKRFKKVQKKLVINK
jgi:hypothetical protein